MVNLHSMPRLVRKSLIEGLNAIPAVKIRLCSKIQKGGDAFDGAALD